MKRYYTVVLLIIVLFVTTSCGYKIAGFSKDGVPIKYYVDHVYNNTFYTDFGDIVEDSIKKELIIYGELSSYNKATFFMDVRLENIDFYSDITSSTDEAISTTITLDLLIIITDSDGIEVFTYPSRTTESFASSSHVSNSISNRSKAIQLATKTAMENFRNAINTKFYD